MSDHYRPPLTMKYGGPPPRARPTQKPVVKPAAEKKAESEAAQKAFGDVLALLQPLAQEDRARILRAVAVFFEVTL